MAKDQNFEEKEMSFLQHLEVFRWHLVRSIIFMGVTMIIIFNLKEYVFEVIIFGPTKTDFLTYEALCNFSEKIAHATNNFISKTSFCIQEINFNLISTKLSGQFMMHLLVTGVGGFIVSSPYFFWEIWRFIKPGLYKKEKKSARGIVFWVSILFFLGVLFGYFVLTPVSVQFLSNYTIGEVRNEIQINSYVSTITVLVLASGIVFQIPVLIYFLTKSGLITPRLLKQYRKHSFIVVLIFSAIITPPDIASQVMLSLPLWLLYEIGIIISQRVLKRQARNEEKT